MSGVKNNYFRHVLLCAAILFAIIGRYSASAADNVGGIIGGTNDGKGKCWLLANSHSGCDGWYLAVNKSFGNGRNKSQPGYESVPRPGNTQDVASGEVKAFRDRFGVSDSDIGLFLEKAKAGEIKCTNVTMSASNEGKYINTHYDLSDESNKDGDGKKSTHVDTVNKIEDSKIQGAKNIGYIWECKMDEGKGEVIYAERDNCANPLYANFKAMTETTEKGEIETKAFIRPSGSGDDTWVPEPAGADEEYTFTDDRYGEVKVSEINVEKGKKVDFKHLSTNTSGGEISDLRQSMFQFKITGKLTSEKLSSISPPPISIDGKDFIEKKKVAAGGTIETKDKKGLKEIDTKDLADDERICQLNTASTSDKKVKEDYVVSNIVCAKVGEPGTGGPEDPPEPNGNPEDPPPTDPGTNGDSADYNILSEAHNISKDDLFKTMGSTYNKRKQPGHNTSTHPDNTANDTFKRCTGQGSEAVASYYSVAPRAIISSYNAGTASAPVIRWKGSVTISGLDSFVSTYYTSTTGKSSSSAVSATLKSNIKLSVTSNLIAWAPVCKSTFPGYVNQIEWETTTVITTQDDGSGGVSKWNSVADNSDDKGIVYAKPTDNIEFRHTIDKKWYDKKADDGTNMTYMLGTISGGGKEASRDRCDITATDPKKTLGGLETEPNVFNYKMTDLFNRSGRTLVRSPNTESTPNGFIYPTNCRGIEEQTTIIHSPAQSSNGYIVRQELKPKFKTTVVNSDVGKRFIEEIKDASPTWALPVAYTCIKPDARSSNPNPDHKTGTEPGKLTDPAPISTNTNKEGSFKTKDNGECEEFGTSSIAFGGTGSSSAQINVPFNYTLTPITVGKPTAGNDCATFEDALGEIDSAAAEDIHEANGVYGCHDDVTVAAGKEGFPNYGMVYAGENFSFSSTIVTNPRANPDVTGSTDPQEYATHTRNTEFKILTFTLAPESPVPTGYGFSKNAPTSDYDCGYYGGSNTNAPYDRKCIVLREKSTVGLLPPEKIVYNKDGKLEGTGTHGDNLDGDNNEVNVIVDDLPVGTKLCFAAAVYPADSHGILNGNTGKGKGAEGSVKAIGDNEPKNNSHSLEADGQGSNDYWAYGAPYCVTIAKKPNFQVWAGGTYSGGNITTSQSPKYMHGGSNGDPFIAQQGASRNQTGTIATDSARGVGNDFRRLFGSWGEQEVIALGGIGGYGSGASLGYTAETSGFLNNGYPNSNAAKNPESTKKDGVQMEDIFCQFSKITLSNSSCKGGLLGGGKYIGNANIFTMNPLILDRLLNRYLGSTGNGPGEKAKQTYHIVYCTKAPGENDSNSCSGYARENMDGDNVLVPKGQVYIYDLRGTPDDNKVIKHNIMYGYDEVNGTKYDDVEYFGISELPQAIIVSGDITIASNVTNIDAWLISLYTGEDDGIISTCPDEPEDATKCTLPLTVHGPVFSYGLRLNRTYGAFNGSRSCGSINYGATHNYQEDSFCTTGTTYGEGNSDQAGFRGSVAPAERFILRADTYLWAYAQAQIVPKATSVHTNEPSPNF